MIENIGQVASRIQLERRARDLEGVARNSRALSDIVAHIVDILAIEKPLKKTA
jgi:hypothetical protein